MAHKIISKPAIHTTAGAIMISFSGVWVVLAHVEAMTSAFYRVLFGGLFLLVAALRHREIKWCGFRHMGLVVVCSSFFALDLFFYHLSILYIGPGLATIIGNFQVFLLTAAGLFLGEKMQLRFLLSLPLAFGGLLLIVGIDWGQMGGTYSIGIAAAFATALSYAGFLLTLRRLQADQMGLSVFFCLTLVSLATSLLLGAEMFRSGRSFAIPDLQSWAVLLLLGVLSQGVGWILITNALPRIRASVAGLILLLQPALAFVWDVLFFQRPTSLVNWVGAAVAVMAIYMGMTGMSRDKSVPTEKRAPVVK